MASTSPSSSSWKPSALARRGRRAGRVRLARPPRATPPRASRRCAVDARRRARRGPSSARPAASGGGCASVHSSLGACAGGGGSWPASSSSCARRMRWRSVGSIPRRTARGSCGVERVERPRVAGRARADRGVDRRSEVELGQRRPQVQAGAADDDRAPALREQRVDLGVGAFGVRAGREGLGDRHEAEQAVLEPRALRVASPRRSGSAARRRPAARPRTPRPGPPPARAGARRARSRRRSSPRRWARRRR